MKPTAVFLILALSFLSRVSLYAEEGWPMPPTSYFIERIPPPPSEGDAVDLSDLDYVLAIQSCATQEEIEHVKLTAALNPFAIFGEVLGADFVVANYPLTDELLTKISATAEHVKDELKAHYARKRPIDAHEKDGVVSYDGRDSKFSYPSGHSLRGWLWALVLSELDPKKKNQLIHCGARVGSDRVVAGVHYQSDIMASRALGRLIFNKLKSDPSFVEELAVVKAKEWAGKNQKQPRADG
jgi:acid phosphatase (class A)